MTVGEAGWSRPARPSEEVRVRQRKTVHPLSIVVGKHLAQPLGPYQSDMR
jgi:hypothetical protein